MKIKYLLLFVIISIFCTSCVTKKLWENTNPNEYVKISANDITAEELNEKGIEYIRYYNGGDFYVKKSAMLKLKDYTLRLFITPFTVVIDATVSTVAVIGLAAFNGKAAESKTSCDIDPDCRKSRQY